MPHPQHIPKLMQQWHELLEAWHAEAPDVDAKEASHRALVLHHMFLCIHPFEDGNGRTARLLMNAFRLVAGLPWIVVHGGNVDVYVGSIQGFEDEFRKIFADAYA